MPVVPDSLNPTATLAWGETNTQAEVKIKGQEQPIKLSRYINLTQTGPRTKTRAEPNAAPESARM